MPLLSPSTSNGGSMSYPEDFPYPSQRMPVYAGNVVATSQPLATQAGLDMLRRGGTAADAALAMAITLTVVEPTSNGLGSDAFALIWADGHVHGLNGSGRAPAGWSMDYFAQRGGMPDRGWDTVTVPGAVQAWIELSRRFGRLPFEQLCEAAIRYAREGFLVSPITAASWAKQALDLKQQPGFADAFMPNGRAPAAGELFRCEAQARTLELIAATGGEAFYRGELAEKLAAHSEACGGAMRLADLDGHRSDWVEPIAQDYGEVRLHEIPPNGQGIVALIALGVLEHLDLARYPVDSVDSVHLQIEAVKIGFTEAMRHVADPAGMEVSIDDMLDTDLLAARAAEISMDSARRYQTRLAPQGGTVYLSAADQSGMMVSMIQSNFWGYGSGVVVPGTGISLQNRGKGFTLQEGHPNRVVGGRRPFHTIIPAIATRGDRPEMSFGVMGQHMQPQGHVQMMTRVFDYGQNPQTASDAPRWQVLDDLFQIGLESGFDPEVIDGLQRRGHLIIVDPVDTGFGGAQLIRRLDHGYVGASDHRKDGQAAGY